LLPVAWRNLGELRPRAHEARRLFHIQNTKPEHCEGCNRNTTQSGNKLIVFAIFCDPGWKWLCPQCDKRWCVSHPEYVCTNVHCGAAWGLLKANSRGELVCESCYGYDRATNGGVRGSGQLVAPTVPIKQDPDHPKPVDRKCENINCPKVAPSDKGDYKLRKWYGRWVCERCWRYEWKRREDSLFCRIGADGNGIVKQVNKAGPRN